MASSFKNEFVSPQATEVPFSFGGANGTVPIGSTLTVIGLTCANTGLTTTEVSVVIYDQHLGNSYYLVKNAPIPPGSSLSVLDGKVVLETGNKLAVSTSISGSIDAIVSYLELN